MDCAVAGIGCDDFFVHPEPSCQVPPTAFPAFNMKLQWESDVQTSANNANAFVGDLDGDGKPEVVSVNYYGNKDICS